MINTSNKIVKRYVIKSKGGCYKGYYDSLETCLSMAKIFKTKKAAEIEINEAGWFIEEVYGKEAFDITESSRYTFPEIERENSLAKYYIGYWYGRQQVARWQRYCDIWEFQIKKADGELLKEVKQKCEVSDSKANKIVGRLQNTWFDKAHDLVHRYLGIDWDYRQSKGD